MSYRLTEIGYQVQRKPAAAAKKIMEQIQAQKGNYAAAARALGVGVSTLKRWLRALQVGGHIPENPRQVEAA